MSTKIVLEFIDAINEADIDKICNLMSDDHLFIDSQGYRVTGKNNMELGWIEYFKLFPDYKIEIEDTFEKSELVCLLGYAVYSGQTDPSFRLIDPPPPEANPVRAMVSGYQ